MDSEPPLDEIIRALADRERRRLLVSLLEHEPPKIDVMQLLADLRTGEKDMEGRRIRAYHSHLPRLEDIGAIEWDRDSDQVSKGPDFGRVVDMLHRMAGALDVDTGPRGGTESRIALMEPIDILLVEDNPGDVRLTEEAFKEGSIQNTLHVVADGVEALDFLHQRGAYTDAPEPALILLDLNLPRGSGEEVLRAVKDDPDLQSIPVIVLTSSKAHLGNVRSDDLDASAYLTKPVDPQALIKKVGGFEGFSISINRFSIE